MPVCSGCNIFFPRLSSGAECSRCTKLRNASESESQVIMGKCICHGCGILYKNLTSSLCGSCLAAGLTIEDTLEEDVGHQYTEDVESVEQDLPKPTLVGILQNAENHRADTTAHRLQNPRQNANLQKGSNYQSLKQAAHKNVAKKHLGQSQSTDMSDISFLIYMLFCRKGRVQKLSMTTVRFSAPTNMKLEEVIKQMLLHAEEGFRTSPATRQLKCPSFNLEDVEIASKECRNQHSERICVAELSSMNWTLGRPMIHFNQAHLGHAQTEDNDSEEECSGTQPSKRKKKTSMQSNKRRKSSPISDSDVPLSNVEEPESELELIAVKRVTRSVTAHQKSLIVPKSPKLTEEPKKITNTASKNCKTAVTEPVTFLTPYHGHHMFDQSGYDTYNFRRTQCIVTPDGEILLAHSQAKEVLVIHKGWTDFRTKGLGPMGGYLGKGTRKWAFKGYTVEGPLTLFHLGGLFYFSGVLERFNRSVLEDELRSLVKAQYHLNIFHMRAKHYNVALPRLRYNAEGAFLGDVVFKDENPPVLSFSSPDTRTMLYDAFLAAPYLEIKPGDELRFTDKYGTPARDDKANEIDDMLVAFTHSSLVDSDHTVIITDIQGIYCKDGELVLYDPQFCISILGNWDENDKGWKIINHFLRGHKCSEYCHKLKLVGASPESLEPRPLQHRNEESENPQITQKCPMLPPLHFIYTGLSPSACTLPPIMTTTRQANGPLRIGFSPTK
ncbi:hypothetical protein M422DRAFT_267688 [Sphaerobolus stellatus SS14]|uniref:Alpha-type protein kinase domain-containing protein n=1 Tax=Sphaerobolus stellatus (strain SS14) TaxID=990650 RepID=A0A0C9UP96_SPHS4|nr:hypothetical protein M422DRAFT_267688 [Sphaerobolus stellatus SS14]